MIAYIQYVCKINLMGLYDGSAIFDGGVWIPPPLSMSPSVGLPSIEAGSVKYVESITRPILVEGVWPLVSTPVYIS